MSRPPSVSQSGRPALCLHGDEPQDTPSVACACGTPGIAAGRDSRDQCVESASSSSLLRLTPVSMIRLTAPPPSPVCCSLSPYTLGANFDAYQRMASNLRRLVTAVPESASNATCNPRYA